MPDIEDTSKRDPGIHLDGLLAAGNDGYIMNMEAQGQRQLVNSTVLPVEIQGAFVDWEAHGFVFGDPVADDPLFREVTLPEGWRKEPSDHDMWSYVVDAAGVRRVAVFYKAAFYDRRAFMRLERPAPAQHDGQES